MNGSEGQHLVLYDGVCGLCNRLIQFVLPRDRRNVFHFASLQSKHGQALLRRYGRSADDLDTMYVVANHRSAAPAILSRARAAVFVLNALGGWWRVPALVDVLPDRVLNWGYDVIARNRYRLFGRYDTCPAPSAEYRNRFIDM